MKYLIIISLLFTLNTSLSNSKEELFEMATNYYKEANYLKAMEQYKAILEKGYHSSAIYYNLGNCYYKMDSIALSILNYEKALKIDLNDKEIKFNLNIAKATTIDKITSLPKGLAEYFYSLFNFEIYTYLAIVFSLLSIIFFTIRDRSKVFYNLFITLFIAFIISILLGYNSREHQSKTFAILMSPNSYVKSEPNEYSENILSIHEGIKLEILDQVEGWNKIRIEDGKIGWLPEDDMEII